MREPVHPSALPADLRERVVAAVFAEKAIGRRLAAAPNVKSQVRHAAGTGSIDVVLRFRGGPVLLIKNKIDAA